MNLVHQPPKTPGDDLEGLLRTFFRAQMPNPWPTAPTPPFRTPKAIQSVPSRRRLMRSRWALAASIGLLLLGSLLLPGRFAPRSKIEQGPDGPGVSDTKFLQDMNKEHQKKQLDAKSKAEREADKGDELPDPE